MQLTKKFAVALLASLAIAACDDDDPVAPVQTAQVRVVHASPDAPAVDVLFDDQVVLSNVPYKAASNYLTVEAGPGNLKVRAAGTSNVVIDANATVLANTTYTAIAAGFLANIAPIILVDDLTLPASGNIKLRLVHAAPTAGPVDIYVTTPTADLTTTNPTLSAVPFGAASAYLEVPAGTYRVRIAPAGTKNVAIDVNNVSLTSQQVRTAIAVDAPGGGSPLGAILLADRN